MKNYTDSDYALNKYSESIVYRFADGIIEITLADYLEENPGKTKIDFMELKNLSDTDYLERVQDENAKTKKNTYFNESDEALPSQPSPEELFFGEINVQEEADIKQQRLTLAYRALESLTEIQRKRYLLNRVENLSTREIARFEGTNHKTIIESLQSAEKKIKKFLENNSKIPPQNA